MAHKPADASILTLSGADQRLCLLPGLGGSIASWDLAIDGEWRPLLRPWDGAATDAFTYACFPLVPWSNRIGAGGFEQDRQFYPMRQNRLGEAYPIHGDGWLQPWHVAPRTDASAGGSCSDPDLADMSDVTLALLSDCFDGNPYHYRATQRFCLTPGRLAIVLEVTHLGADPLPYGLGLHPYFPSNALTRLQMHCDGVWLSGADPMPVSHSDTLPASFDYRQAAPLEGPMIDHCFTGWDGRARITYPDEGIAITLEMHDCPGYALMYRPPGLAFFCLEPITHPIDAFHMPGRPGLRVLAQGESLSLRFEMRSAAL